MLPQTHRLSQNEFERVRRTCRRTCFDLVDMCVVFDTSSSTKLSVVAPKKIYVNAVSRHRARRRIYQCIRKHITALPQGALIILFLKDDILSRTSDEIETLVATLITTLTTPQS